MKLSTILYSTTLAAASVQAVAIAAPIADPEAGKFLVYSWEIIDEETANHVPAPGRHFCYMPGQPCSKLKRAAEAIAELFAEPTAEVSKRGMTAEGEQFMKDGFQVGQAVHDKPIPGHHFCYLPGEPCTAAKRSALALAEAVAEAEATANPTAKHSCLYPGESCSKTKREAIEKREAEALAYFKANPALEVSKRGMTAEGEQFMKDGFQVGQAVHDRPIPGHKFCYMPGEVCTAAKRARDAVVAILEERSEGAEPEAEKDIYALHKRALQGLSEKMSAMI